MSTLTYIIVFTFLGSIVSLIGGIILLGWEKLAVRIAPFLAAFAAGTLLATAFLDLLPEAEEAASGRVDIFFWTLVGFVFFFLLERSIHWFHHHDEEPEQHTNPTVTLIQLGDSLHNFIDGVAIAAAFMLDINVGIVTAIAVGAHEIPHEIGDFGVMLKAGLSRSKALWYNVLSACTAFAGALLTYYIGGGIEGILPIFLSITAGFFIYIAASDLIPEIYHKHQKKFAITLISVFLLGIVLVGVFVALLD